MLDFRYHALSLVAVFLALAIGIVLGVTIGDSLLSDAERSKQFVDPLTAGQIEGLIARAYAAPKEIVERAAVYANPIDN